jgi:hypothetical protein
MGEKNRRLNKARKEASKFECDSDTAPDWEHECCVCGARPIVPASGMCGPCTFGDAETIGGNW